MKEGTTKPVLKILHLINYPGKGGSEKYIQSLCCKLLASPAYNGRIYLAYSQTGPLLDEMAALGIECFHVPMKSPWDVKAAVMLKELCRKLSIDVVHTHFLRENFVAVLSKLLGNRIVLVNTVHMLEEKSFVIRTVNRVFSGYDDGIITVSRAVRDLLASEGIPAAKMKTIYNGVDFQHFNTPLNENKVRSNYGIDENDFLVVSAARFSEEKGHRFLLNSIARFKELYSREAAARNVRFLLAGDGALFDECRSLSSQLGLKEDVIFAGYVTDMRSLMQAGDLYVSHSSSESLGISVLEAMAGGLPVVTTNSGGPAEIVNEDTGTGILTGKTDTVAFAAGIMKMALDLGFYEKCRKNAVAAAKERFSLDEMVRLTWEYYSSLAERTD